MSNQGSLSAATQDRKARLAQLRSLKRKQPQDESSESLAAGDSTSLDEDRPRKRQSPERSPSPGVTQTYLSGRNYDVATKGPRLGFENAPDDGQMTVERSAQKLQEEERQQRAKEDADDKPLDLFKMQPKRPNWDLKRDLAKQMEVLNVRTDNAVVLLLREQFKQAQVTQQNGQETAQDNASAGDLLVEATNAMESADREERALLTREDEEDSGW